MLVVWEPMLPTDLAPPVSSALARLSDRRAMQYWDRKHLVAQSLRQAPGGQPEFQCCDDDGILWDIAGVFGRQARWADAGPRAEFLDGPVWLVKDRLAEAVARQLAAP